MPLTPDPIKSILLESFAHGGAMVNEQGASSSRAGRGEGNWAYADPGTFLYDGFSWRTSPGMILVADGLVAVDIARLLMENGLPELPAARSGAQLLAFDPAAVSQIPAAEAARACAYAKSGGHWLFLQDVHKLLDSPGGCAMIEETLQEMAAGTLPCVLASIPETSLKLVTSSVCRLIGLAPTMFFDGAGDPKGFNRIRYLGMRAADRRDTGWAISVRYNLTSPVSGSYQTAAPDAEYALPMVERIALMGGKEKPVGAYISFRPDSFQISQEDAVFAAAEKIARRAVGRPLGRDERVEARRGLFYY